MMENVDLAPPDSAVVNVTAPSVDVVVAPDEIVEIPKINDEPSVPRQFDDKNTRMTFILKVLLFILLQEFSSALIMIPFLCKNYEHQPVYKYISVCVFLFMLALLLTCEKARTKNPYKIIIFIAYPIISAAFAGFLTLGYTIREMYVAQICSCLAIFALLIYSVLVLKTSLEYKVTSGICISALTLVLLLFRFMTVINELKKITVFNYVLGAFLECSYTVWDLQYMTSPNYRYTMTPSDIILGVLLIRIDLIYYIYKYSKIFVRKIIGSKDKN